MDPTLLHKRFKTLVEFGMATQRDPNGPLVTHSTRGDMDIWQILSFEFNADVQQVKAILLPLIQDERRNISWVWLKHIPTSHLQAKNVPIAKVETPDGDWSMYENWRENVSGKSSHPRYAAICEFARMGGMMWRPSVLVMAAERIGEFLSSDDEYLTLSTMRMIKQWHETKTMWIAHEPQTVTRHYVQWPRLPASHHDTVRLDITGLEEYFTTKVVEAAHESYRAVYGVFLNHGDAVAEQLSVGRDFDHVISRGDLTYPGEPHA